MPKRNAALGVLHRLIVRQALDHLLFGYLIRATRGGRDEDLTALIRQFEADFGVDVDDTAAKTAYYRMLSEYRRDCDTLKHQLNQ